MDVDPDKIRTQLERLASSPEFARTERMVRFLRFVVEKTLQSDVSALRERQIGIEVFDRPADWDPKLDNIVRSEARRLRVKLDAYGRSGSPDETIRITMPKGGYAVQFQDLTPPSDAGLEIPPATSSLSLTRVRNRLIWQSTLALATILALVCCAFLLSSRWHRETVEAHGEDFQIVPFSTEAGEQFSPSISPDGKEIAFVWDGGDDRFNIYVKPLGGSSATRLTNDAVPDTHPSWSPDGSHIAFFRRYPSETYLVIKNLDSGNERILQRMQAPLSMWSSANPFSGCQTLAWFPKGDQVIVTASQGATKGYGLVTISTVTGEEHVITSPPGDDQDCYPRLTLDGRHIAFIRSISHGVGYLYTIDIDGRNLKQLTFDGHDLRGLDWTPDAKKIIFASRQRGAYELREISREGGTPVPLPSDTASVSDPVMARNGSYIAFVESDENWNIWRAPLAGGQVGRPERFLASSGQNHSPSYSPDGKMIAFVSDRSGNPEIWFCDADGGRLRQMTHFGGPWLGTIRWSPDGSQIVFDARPHGHSAIFTMPTNGGSPKMVESEDFEDRRPSWSRDGKSIYYDSTRGGRPEIWKRSLDTGESHVIAPPGSLSPLESLDGSRLFFLESDARALWMSDVDGTNSWRLPQIHPAPDLDWAPGPRDLYFTVSNDEDAEFFAYGLTDGHMRRIGRLAVTLSLGTPSLAVSPDGKWILFAEVDHRKSDIKLREAQR